MAQTDNHTDRLEKLLAGDRFSLGRCITMAESTRPEHRRDTEQILAAIPEQKSMSLRVAISGSPGVGKSTFIEKLGLHLVENGKKVAVLAIDPTSSLSKGSILGDKTRMSKLSVHPKAFVRPSPAGQALGGVADRTKETIYLCEAAGYDVILIETVGVGQSEYYAAHLADLFLLLILPGAGDALQGIKRGIVEMADIVAINKADGDRVDLANQTYRQYKQALHLFLPKENGWPVPVLKASALENLGIKEIWQQVLEYEKSNGRKSMMANRAKQDKKWASKKIRDWVIDSFFEQRSDQNKVNEILQKIELQQLTAYQGMAEMKKLIH